jgi:carboxypeptidase Taq
MPDSQAAFAELCSLSRHAAVLGSVSALLGWDQETYMPSGGSAARADQQAALAALIHERKTSKRMGDLIAACEGDANLLGEADSPVAACVREFRRDYDLATKLPTDLVAELARIGSQTQEVWKVARAASDFPMFGPWLEKMVALTRRKAECYGVPRGGEPYDALLEEYEPGMTSAQVEAIFAPLRQRLAAFLKEVKEKGRPPSAKCIESSKIDPKLQHEFGLFVLNAMTFDLKAGRLDVTTHPFCSGLGPGDTRLTTRYRDERFTDALYGTMHEAGHGLYEQGLPKSRGSTGPAGDAFDPFGTPLSEAISLGIHESQSRMWENLVGRSREFWVWALPHAGKTMGLSGCTEDELYRAVNTATPSFIRVEADEATYNLHIMVRFEIERALVKGDLKIPEVPAAWNKAYKEFLGLDIPDDRRGCLQDVHWSFGAIGYFPTYTLGNLYAAQFWETIHRDLPNLSGQIAQGQFGPLRQWLLENIHKHGKRYRAADLCQRITGKPLSADAFLNYIERKIRPIYGL